MADFFPALADEAWLREQYVGLGRSTTSIAAEVGCSYNSVLYRLEQFGVEKRRCVAEGCKRELHSDNLSGYCHGHQGLGLSEQAKARRIELQRQRRLARRLEDPRPTCAVVGCSQQLHRDNDCGYCQKHRGQAEAVRLYKQQHGVAHAAERRAVNQQWYADNRESVLVRVAEYRKAHPEVHRAVLSRRKVRTQASMDALDRELSVSYRKAIANDLCYYCGAVETHHDDHYVPLANGGTDHWWNLVRACAPCNFSKHTMSGDEFLLLIKGGGGAHMKKYSESVSQEIGLLRT
jgi:5-methylcytosine-specific restriction endonuclease McrA